VEKKLSKLMEKVTVDKDISLYVNNEGNKLVIPFMTELLFVHCSEIALMDEPTDKLSKAKLVKSGYLNEGDVLEIKTITVQEPKNSDPKHKDFYTIVEKEKEAEIVYEIKNQLGLEYFVNKDDAIRTAVEINEMIRREM